MTNYRAASRTALFQSREFEPRQQSSQGERGMSTALLVSSVIGLIWLGSMIYTIANWAMA
ncbi:morphogenic membrane protein MmpA [Streptomyces sp. NPDC088400]|uniref:morphogenic membrane protein MmpA n=1 Tax=Streptomyces sp. NPDC088400 TaxID=3365861 RepID=UPI00382B8AC6